MKRPFRYLLLAGLTLALLVAGCAAPAPRSTQAAYDSYERAPAAPGAMATAAPAPAMAPREAKGGASPALQAPAGERKIIFTANLQLVVQETQKTVDIIKDAVVARGGFVSSSSVWQQGNILYGSMTVRVPAGQMDSFLGELKKMAVEVKREETGGQDVTEEYVDIQAQLKNLEATETELRELLTEVRQKTGKAEDVMAVYRELTSVRGQIDVIKGRMQYLDRMTELATVYLELSERGPEPIGQPGWQPVQTVRRALNGLVEASKFGVDALIWIVLFLLPILIVPALVAWLIVWLVRRHSEKKKAGKLSRPESLS